MRSDLNQEPCSLPHDDTSFFHFEDKRLQTIENEGSDKRGQPRHRSTVSEQISELQQQQQQL